MRANTTPRSPRVENRMPRTSVPFTDALSLVSGTKTKTAINTTTPIGTLIKNAQCHEKSVVSQPPTSGPIAAMPPIVAPHTAKAAARDLPTKTAFRIDSEEGRIIAAPTPCKARAPMMVTGLPDIATSTLETTKTTRPITKISRLPNRSARRPATMSSDAKVSE